MFRDTSSIILKFKLVITFMSSFIFAGFFRKHYGLVVSSKQLPNETLNVRQDIQKFIDPHKGGGKRIQPPWICKIYGCQGVFRPPPRKKIKFESPPPSAGTMELQSFFLNKLND